MANTQDMSKIFNALDTLLADVDLESVSAEGAGFDDLPSGYYLCEVEKAEFKESKTSHLPMVGLQFKVVEDGINIDKKTGKDITLSKTKNRKIFKYYTFKDNDSVKRYASDMLKFEGDIVGEPILPKEAFTTAATLVDALEVIEGLRIYIHVDAKELDSGEKSVWYNVLSWKRANFLQLPV